MYRTEGTRNTAFSPRACRVGVGSAAGGPPSRSRVRPNPDLDLCRYVTHAEIGGGPAAPLVVDELLTMLIMGPLLGPA